MGTFDPISDVFERLDNWRKLPNYQLERRADIFFAIYLRQFLEHKLGVALRPQLIPEFPVHLKTIEHGRANNQSVKIDYVAVAQDLSRVFFIEFKTDKGSRRDAQDEYLKKTCEKGIGPLLEGIRCICGATAAKRKYEHLLRLLEAAGLITMASAGDRYGEFTIQVTDCAAEVRYLQPGNSDDANHVIGFDDFAQWLERYDDPFSVRFRRSVQMWSGTTA